MKRFVTGLLLVVSMFMLVIFDTSKAEQTSYDIETIIGQTSEDYSLPQSSNVKAFRFGKTSLGKFQVSGNINESTTYNGYSALGLESGTLVFSYEYRGTHYAESDVTWCLVDDGSKSVDQIKLDASIKKGVLIIQKSYDNQNWVQAAPPVVNYFVSVPSGKNKFYSADGEDLAKGTYYKVIMAYKMHKKKGNYGLFGALTDYDEIWCTETYAFYACVNTANISLHNMAVNEETISLSRKAYETDGNYKYDSTKSVEKMSYGSSGICKINIKGQFADTKSTETIGLVRDDAVLSLDYHGSLRSGKDESWKLFSSDSTSVNGVKLQSKMGMGTLLVQKSDDGVNYSNILEPINNIFGNYPNGLDICKVSDSGYYRVIVAYQTQRKTGKTLWWDNNEDKFHVELFSFQLDKRAVEGIETEEDGYLLNVLEKGETLTDGASTTVGFVVDKLSTFYDVKVNGKAVSDGQSFTENGVYDIQISTPLGKTKAIKVYVFRDDESNGALTYFKDVPVSGYRVFREGSLPTFDNRTVINLLAIPDSVPALTGSIVNLDTNEEIIFDGSNRSALTITLTEGTYHADLFSGNTESGSVYHYELNFNIIPEESKPNVNYCNLMTADRLSDLSSRYYQVAYQTTRGGFIFVCFADYQRAFNYAYEIEKRFVEDGHYKSITNPNVKIEYPATNEGLIELTQAINHYAEKNVEVSFFDPTDIFTYRTLDDLEKLENLEALSIPESVKVIPSEEEKAFMYSRQPFLNGFMFIQAADYDVITVDAFCYENGQTYPIAFGKSVDEQLTVSSEYQITETNIYGDTNTYNAFFVNKNQSVVKWKITDKNENSMEIMSVENIHDITVATAEVVSAVNGMDDNSIVKIKSTGSYSNPITCQLSDLRGLVLDKKGVYSFTFVDRVGNTYTQVIHILGSDKATKYTEGCFTYSDLYNKVHLQK